MINVHLEKIGSIGGIFAATAAATPCCVPFLAAVSGTIGLGVLSPYSAYLAYAVQIFAFLAIVGSFLSFRKHKNPGPVALSIASFCLLVFVYNYSLNAWLLYLSLIMLATSGIWNVISIRKCNQCKAEI